jgi:hypothetical protein
MLSTSLHLYDSMILNNTDAAKLMFGTCLLQWLKVKPAILEDTK